MLEVEQNSRDPGVVSQPHCLRSQARRLRGHRVADAMRENSEEISSDRSMKGILQPRRELLDVRPSRHAWHLGP